MNNTPKTTTKNFNFGDQKPTNSPNDILINKKTNPTNNSTTISKNNSPIIQNTSTPHNINLSQKVDKNLETETQTYPMIKPASKAQICP